MGGEQGEEEGDGENLFGDEMENDYRANPELDRSETREILQNAVLVCEQQSDSWFTGSTPPCWTRKSTRRCPRVSTSRTL